MSAKTKILVLAAICPVILVSIAVTASAQSGFGEALFEQSQLGEASPTIFLNVSPKNPKPGDSVSIELKSTWTDLNQAEIAWMEDGNTIKSGLGQTKYFITAGSGGSQVIVTASVRTAEGAIYSYQIPIRPGSVDIVWESNSSVPPFYKGKALYPRLGVLKLVAIPNMFDSSGAALDPKTLVYTWKRTDTVLGSQSGLGRYYIVMSDNIYRTPFTVSVTVASGDGQYVAEGTISIDAVNPFVEIYQSSPIYGVLYNKSIDGQFAMMESEVTFDAFPYYFSVKNRFDPVLVYNWSLNYQTITGQRGPSLSLKGSGQSGSANLYLEITNQTKFYEGGTASLNLSFGGNR